MSGAPDPQDPPETGALALLPPALAPSMAPIGAAASTVRAWFDTAVEDAQPDMDGTLGAEREAAYAFQRMAKASNTRNAYRAAVRVWCDWCALRGLPPLPACGQDVATFLAAERRRGMTPNTIDLRRAAIRYLHRAAGCAVPTDDACVSETVAGIRRHAASLGELPEKKVAATATIIQQLLGQIPDDLRGKRDRAILLVGFAGALRRSELAAIRVDRLEKTDRGLRLTIPQTKGSQTAAVTVPLPYGRTELCPVRAITTWLLAASIFDGPVFRRIWLPAMAEPGGAMAAPRIGREALSTRAIADIVQARAVAAGFGRHDLGGHSLKRGALTTGMEAGIHPAKLKRLGRHKSFDVLGEYLEFGDLFEGHPLSSVL